MRFFVLVFLAAGLANAEPVAIRVDEFKSDAVVKITEVADANGQPKSIVGILKREIEREIESDTAFELSTTAVLALRGNVRELTIDNLRLDNAGSPLQRIARMRVDFTAVDEATGREIVKKRNLLTELEYYTDTYSLEQGVTEREALEEDLLLTLAKSIVDELRSNDTALPRTPASKKVELSDEEKEMLDALEPEVKEKRKIYSASLDFQNESVHIPEGTLVAAGQRKQTTNRFIQTSTLKLEPWRFGKTSELKGVTIGKYEPAEQRELSLQRAELEYLINPSHTVKLGTVSASLNRFVFDQTVAGATYEGRLKFGGLDHTVTAVGGREFRPTGIGDFPRYNYGGFWEAKHSKWGSLKLVADASKDDRATLSTSGVTTAVENRIYGVSGKINAPWEIAIDYDAFRSAHKENSIPDTSYLDGDLYQVKVAKKLKSLSLGGEWYFADEQFRTIFGSATPDKRKATLTGSYPGQWKIFDYQASGEFTRSSKDTKRDIVEVLASSGLNLTASPFKSSERIFLKDLTFPFEVSTRRNYDEVKFAGTQQTKSLENLRYLAGVKQKIGTFYEGSASYSGDRERNRVRKELFVSEEFKWENSLKKTFFEKIDATLKGNYRTKDAGGNQDRFVTGGATLAYKKDEFSAQFDYLKDVKRGTVKSQDSTKDRFTLDLSNSFENGPFKNTVSLRGDYEKNHFDDVAQNHDRLTVNLDLKVGF